MPGLRLRLVTPERTLYEGEVRQVTLPTTGGEITVLPGHLPVVTVLGAGELRYRSAEGDEHLAVAGGVVEVTGSSVTVMAESAERAVELDEAEVERAHQRAAAALAEASREDTEEYARLAAQLERELARLRVARRYRRRPAAPLT